jgi:hypothetical protein
MPSFIGLVAMLRTKVPKTRLRLSRQINILIP